MNNMIIQQLADSLHEARLNRQPIGQVSSVYPDLGIDDAYAIQLKNVARSIAGGESVVGKKIGLTSKAMQQMLGVDEPDYGILLSSMNMAGCAIPVGALIQPKIEAELAFILKDDLSGPDASIEDVLAATECIVPAFEVVDSRVKDWKISIIDTVADNASSGGFILSDQLVPVDADLAAITMKLYKNGECVNQGSGADVLGNPAYCVAWLANKLHRYGIQLNKGEIVLSGALSAAPVAAIGDAFVADFGEYGKLEASFA